MPSEDEFKRLGFGDTTGSTVAGTSRSSDRLEYDAETDSYAGTFDFRDLHPSVAVVNAVAAVADMDPLAFDPIGDCLDPDALDVLLGADSATGTDCSVSFNYASSEVTISTTGRIEVRPQ
ncbi:HalOD1 output domain-containing protein [Haloarculaceae archaeon H-GB2-1]|nr:hypothetical protein [Haloarculaceae archaeon H-GB1-1]MEA5385842.1 HalOD1 output domain-containing protein [Haloarculaceae archaeon H-GB11]MEA5407344.1 HalOD1 output domain-containing protein [Haloarculaceae archaeon H-GB2-1]